ncbi:hypothetical protein BDZ91DRAFT_760594 [Kalaharituber pfeilii]|nr:hypothetical protein BDZ91DRAFT_760594 [Kalaharituber pfeilii]
MADDFKLLHPNSTHVSFDGHATFNASVLEEFGYVIYSNGTLSNATRCYLAFDIYKPVMLSNGTVLNGTKCDSPIDPIETRGAVGIVFSVLFAALIVICLVDLRKHGASHVPVEKQFRLVSRRWPWYWAVFTAAVGCISGFMAIDVDRDYIQGVAIILQNIFYYVTLPTVLAATWEMTRHWGSFEERKILDVDPFFFKAEDRRSKIEFWLPMTFFLSVLRTWTPIQKQHITAATDLPFRASSLFAVFALLVIIASAINSRYYYRHPIPLKILLCVLLAFIRIVYGIICVFSTSTGWEISVLNAKANPGYVYGLGYAPIVQVLLVMCVGGLREANEDLEIIRLRREREFRDEVEMREAKRERERAEKEESERAVQLKEREAQMEMRLAGRGEDGAV